MEQSWRDIGGRADSGLLLIADHASNRVPAGIDLGIDSALLQMHIALDIGVAQLGTDLCARLNCPGILGNVSRLVIDLNREQDAQGLIPVESDGHHIPGNVGDKSGRIALFYHPYHARIEAQIALQRPSLLISLHSFTPQLAAKPEEPRPWEIGILYNHDARAARIALPLLAEAGVTVGDNLPYSGKVLNATMNRHGEGNGIAYLGLEVRQDLIAVADGVSRWGDVLARVIDACLAGIDQP